jgi:hypothetical protein
MDLRYADGIAGARTTLALEANPATLQRRLPGGWELAPYQGDDLRGTALRDANLLVAFHEVSAWVTPPQSTRHRVQDGDADPVGAVAALDQHRRAGGAGLADADLDDVADHVHAGRGHPHAAAGQSAAVAVHAGLEIRELPQRVRGRKQAHPLGVGHGLAIRSLAA